MEDCKDARAVTLQQSGHVWIFIYRKSTVDETLRLLGRYAADPTLSFTWADAGRLAHAIRNMEEDFR